MPARAGPAIIPNVDRMLPSAAAAGSSSRSTSLGSSAARDGLCIASKAPCSETITNTSHRIGCARRALPKRITLPTISAASDISTINRRSSASARAPPSSAKVNNAASSTTPSRPTAAVLWVNVKTWYGTATNVIWLPNSDTNRPMYSSR